jgi:hypothetical protein
VGAGSVLFLFVRIGLFDKLALLRKTEIVVHKDNSYTSQRIMLNKCFFFDTVYYITEQKCKFNESVQTEEYELALRHKESLRTAIPGLPFDRNRIVVFENWYINPVRIIEIDNNDKRNDITDECERYSYIGGRQIGKSYYWDI